MIYAVKAAEFIKIGHTNDVAKRLRSLQTGSPHRLEVVLELSGGVREEAELHARLEKWRAIGEWFHLTEEVRAVLDELRERSTAPVRSPKTDPQRPFSIPAEVRVSAVLSGYDFTSMSDKEFREAADRERSRVARTCADARRRLNLAHAFFLEGKRCANAG